MSGNETIPSSWSSSQDHAEEVLKKMAAETGARLERDAATGRLRLVHDP